MRAGAVARLALRFRKNISRASGGSLFCAASRAGARLRFRFSNSPAPAPARLRACVSNFQPVARARAARRARAAARGFFFNFRICLPPRAPPRAPARPAPRGLQFGVRGSGLRLGLLASRFRASRFGFGVWVWGSGFWAPALALLRLGLAVWGLGFAVSRCWPRGFAFAVWVFGLCVLLLRVGLGLLLSLPLSLPLLLSS